MFDLSAVRAYECADFAARCVPARGMNRVVKALRTNLLAPLALSGYGADERAMVARMGDFALKLAEQLEADSKSVERVKREWPSTQ